MRALDHIVAGARRTPFFALVRMIERTLSSGHPIGGTGPFSQEPVRFKHDSSLTFHSSDIVDARVQESETGSTFVELTTSFSGLTGAVSPLPLYFDEHLCGDESELERAFLDLFHHRFLGLFYRGMSKFAVQGAGGDAEQMGDRLLRLGGLLPERAEAVTRLGTALLLRLSPLLVIYPANAERLVAAVRDVVGHALEDASISVVSMSGSSVVLEPSERPRLGRDLTLSRNSALGASVPAPASGVRLVIGPVSPACCMRLAPEGDLHALLMAVAELFTPETVDLEVEVVLTNANQARLGSAKLRRSAWIGRRGRPTPLRFRGRDSAQS